MDHITEIATLRDLNNLPTPLLHAMIDSEAATPIDWESDESDTPVMDALYVMTAVLKFIREVPSSTQVSILNYKALITLDGNNVYGEW